jgi:hypothetical protein
MLGALSWLRWSNGDLAGAREATEQRHALAVETGADEHIASSLNMLAAIFML